MRLTVVGVFHAELSAVVLSQPMTAYESRSDTRFLDHILDRFIEHRTLGSRGAPLAVHTLIHSIVDELAQIKNVTAAAKREQLRQTVCEILGQQLTAKQVTQPTRSYAASLAASSGKVEALIVAIKLDQGDLVRNLVMQGASTRTKSGVFGNTSPLRMAVRDGSLEIVKAMLKQALSGTHSKCKARQTRQLHNCISDALTTNDKISAEFLS
tara:strand:- start:44 stop:676 length:633 start_codon:yes stop_codon:yes gene_type:complete